MTPTSLKQSATVFNALMTMTGVPMPFLSVCGAWAILLGAIMRANGMEREYTVSDNVCAAVVLCVQWMACQSKQEVWHTESLKIAVK